MTTAGLELAPPPLPEEPATALPRVLMVVKRPTGPGGMQQQARRVAFALQRAGAPVTMAVGARPGGKAYRWASRLPVRALAARNQWAFARELYRLLIAARDEYDVVHVHGFGLEVFAAVAARRVTRRPLVVKCGTAGPGTKLHLYGTLTRIFPPVRALWRRVDCWVSISEQTGADLRRLGLPESAIAEIPNGVDTEQFRPLEPDERRALRAERGVGEDEVVIVTAARLSPHKKVDLLVRAFLAAAPRFPEARLWVLGKGEQADELRALAAASPHGEQIRFLGRLKPAEVRPVLQCADAFALVSLWEGLSNALLEAMACRLPVVVSAVSGMTDVVRDGAEGFLVPPDEEEATAAALERLLSDAELRRCLGEAARARVTAEYGLQRTVERLLALYADLRNSSTLNTQH